MIPVPLQQLMKDLAALPGLGPRSAQRAALHMLGHPEVMRRLRGALDEVSESVKTCSCCGNVGLADPCHVCTDDGRDASVLCVVEGVDDLWALERSGAFAGRYHVLGGVISALNGVGPDDVRLPQLVARIEKGGIQEVILALGASVDGQTTAHLIARRLQPYGVVVSTLARGIPVGAEVDYMDEGTLHLALKGRVGI